MTTQTDLLALLSEAAVVRPWESQINFERDGMWADYVAWESWIYSRMEAQAFSSDSCWEYERAIDDMDSGTKIGLYCIMCDLADGSVS